MPLSPLIRSASLKPPRSGLLWTVQRAACWIAFPRLYESSKEGTPGVMRGCGPSIDQWNLQADAKNALIRASGLIRADVRSNCRVWESRDWGPACRADAEYVITRTSGRCRGKRRRCGIHCPTVLNSLSTRSSEFGLIGRFHPQLLLSSKTRVGYRSSST
ncbi:hypothetical protein VTK56DRAFT_1973 [Thermocarpiscus australiensis]